MTQSVDISVSVESLSRKFGEFTAVDNVSFEIKRGEVFGLLGPNGAGKSTTIRMLCGIIPPSSGIGYIEGVPLGAQSEKVKTIIGYMSQKFSLYEDLSAYENLEFYSGVYPIPSKERKNRIEEALQIAGLTDRKDSLTGTLSGGLKQKLALGCSLLHRPQVLFLDEPTAGVDPLSRRMFWEMIYSLSESGVTVLVTTHYMDEAEHCDRIAFINRGQLIRIGSPSQLKRTGKPVIRIICNNWQKAFNVLIEDKSVAGEPALFGTAIHLLENDLSHEHIREILDSHDCGVESIKDELPSLEDVFVDLLRPGAK